MSIDNKFIKGARRFSTTIAVPGVADASTPTIPLTIIPAVFSDGDPIEYIVDRVATTGALTTGNEETIVGIVSGSNSVTSDRGVEGTAQAHAAGAVVEIKLTSDMWNRLVEGILLEHNEFGQHKIDKLDALRYGADAGSSDAYAITLDPAPEAYYAGMRIGFKANTVNTAGATINVNGLGAKTIKKLHDQTLADGDIEAGQVVYLVYDGTDFQMQSQISNGPVVATAAEVVTGTENAKFATPLSLVPLTNQNMFKNMIMNSNMELWSRSLSLAFSNPTNKATAKMMDRWICYRASFTTGLSVGRIDGTTVRGSVYGARIQRANGNSSTAALYLDQSIKTETSIKARAKKVTLSFWARCGSTYSPTSALLNAAILTGTGTDQSNIDGLTGVANVGNANVALLQSWQKFTVTTSAVIGDSVTQLAIQFAMTPIGTAGTDDWFDITQVQLEVGDTASPYEPKPQAQELFDCQEFIWVPDTSATNSVIAMGTAFSTTHTLAVVKLPRRMRAIPAIVATAGDWRCNDFANAATTVTAIAIASSQCTPDVLALDATVASGLTQYRPYAITSSAASKVMQLDADI